MLRCFQAVLHAPPESPSAAGALMALLIVVATTGSAHAAKCDASGSLRFVGITADGSRSVWLSRTSPGSFRLEASKQGIVADQWSAQRRDVHLSASPVVSQGSGGTHKLIDAGSNNCVLDTANQSGGITLPPIERPPDWTRPPGVPTHPIVLPPIPSHPIVLPPEPGIPVHPIVLPPEPVIPSHPIALPPEPGIPTPPIVLPPGAGIQPRPPDTVPAAEAGSRSAEAGAATGVMRPMSPCRIVPDGEGGSGTPSDCVGMPAPPGAATSTGSPPLTSGRDLPSTTLWNAWADMRYLDGADRRYGRQFDSRIANLSLGADRRIGDRLVAGISLLADRGDATGFDGVMKSNSKGILAGPYVAYLLSQHWVLDGSLAYGRMDNETRLGILKGDYAADNTAMSVSARGEYRQGEGVLRPRLSAFYQRIRAESYSIQGSLDGMPLALGVAADKQTLGVAEAALEINRPFATSAGGIAVPFAEATATYRYRRINDGEILASELTTVATGPWSGALRLGVRGTMTRSTAIEASAGYLSLGQGDLAVWELRLFLSSAF